MQYLSTSDYRSCPKKHPYGGHVRQGKYVDILFFLKRIFFFNSRISSFPLHPSKNTVFSGSPTPQRTCPLRMQVFCWTAPLTQKKGTSNKKCLFMYKNRFSVEIRGISIVLIYSYTNVLLLLTLIYYFYFFVNNHYNIT